MGDHESAQQTSKKRGALKQLSRDNPGLDDEEDSAELENGTFKKASDEVLANRRIVRVKRKEPSAKPSAAPNPFAGIQLIPTTAPVSTTAGINAPLAESLSPAKAVVEGNQKALEDGRADDNKEAIDTEEGDEVDSKTADVKEAIDTEKGDEVDSKTADVKDSAGEEAEKTKDEVNEDDNNCAKRSDDQAVSNVTNIGNAAEGTDQTADPIEKDSGGDQTERKEKEAGESKEADKNNDNNGAFSSFQQHSSSKNAFTGLASTEASGSSFSFGLVSQDGSTNSGSLFGFGLANTTSSSLFSPSGSSIIEKSESSRFPPKQEVSTETGEENEKVVFSADSVMFEYLEGGWKERGKGEVKVNVSTNDGKARLVMRAKGNYRLILNASLYPEMKLASMDKKGITFACVNSISEGKEGLSTFALKFKDPTIVEEFRVAVDKHKESKPVEKVAEAALKTPENSPTATDD